MTQVNDTGIDVRRPKAMRKGCITCRERRVACDRLAPACSRCIRAKTHCKGYGLKLSWPSKTDDGRRAIVGKQQDASRHPVKGRHLVRVSAEDIELYYRLESSRSSVHKLVADHYRWPLMPLPRSHARPTSEEEPRRANARVCAAVQVQDTASITLSTVVPPSMHYLGTTLTRIGFQDSSASSQAVLRALLALSSLHRYGLTDRAMELKLSSLGALAAASKDLNGPAQIIQHIAAGMLLCSFEIYAFSSASKQWLRYIVGIRHMLAATPAAAVTVRGDPDGAAMISWALYHYCLARFTMRYWRHSETQSPDDTSSDDTSSTVESTGDVPVPSYESIFGGRQTQALFRDFAPSLHTTCLNWITEVCDLVDEWPTYRALGAFAKQQYKARLRRIDEGVRATLPPETYGEVLDAQLAASPDCIWLCQLAMLIYLHRTTKALACDADQTERDVEAAFRVLEAMPACNRHFFVFIVAFEAGTDERRAIVLDVMERSEKTTRPLGHIRSFIEATWAQDDLRSGGGRKLEYWDKLSAVMSIATIPPSFV